MSPDITYWEDYLGSLNNFEKIWSNLSERLLKYPCFEIEETQTSFSELGIYSFDNAGYCVQTVNEYVEAINSLVVLLRSIDQETITNTLLPRNINVDLSSALDELIKEADYLSEQLSEESFLIAMQNKDNVDYCINISDDAELAIGNSGKNIGGHLSSLANAYDKAIIATKTIIMILNKVSPILYKDYIEGKKQYSTELVQLRREAKSVSKTAKEQAKHVDEYLAEIVGIRKKIGELGNNANTNLSSIKTILAESKTTKVELDSLVKGNTSLSENLQELEETATTFNNEITSMKQNHANGITKVDKLLSDLAAKYAKFSTDIDAKAKTVYSEIESLREQANTMLSGATNAALATAFENKLKEAVMEVASARRYYNWAIFIFIITLLPLASVLLGMAFKMLPLEPWIMLPSVLLAMPGLLFQHFAASRYTDANRICEDYSYKYSLAMGVEGYKKAAPEYADEIAASTFEQIAFNPADNLRGQKQVRMLTHPILELLTTKMGLSLMKAKTLSPELLVKIFIDKLFKVAEKNNLPLSETCKIINEMLEEKCQDEDS